VVNLCLLRHPKRRADGGNIANNVSIQGVKKGAGNGEGEDKLILY
jgi:hypothetical protein